MTIADRLEAIDRLPDLDREALCDRCGACCFLGVRIGSDLVRIPDLRCPYLEGDRPGDYRCSVYDRRLEVAPWCRPIARLLERSALPASCAYTSGIDDYRGARVLEGPEARLAAARVRRLAEIGQLRPEAGQTLESLDRFLGGEGRVHLPVLP